VLTTPHRKNVSLQKVHTESLRLGLIDWYIQSNEKGASGLMGSGGNYTMSSQMICTPQPILKSRRIRWEVACSTYWGEERCIQGFGGET
jgi:hypothetical protein